jgi:hypothetical protein
MPYILEGREVMGFGSFVSGSFSGSVSVLDLDLDFFLYPSFSCFIIVLYYHSFFSFFFFFFSSSSFFFFFLF